MALPHIFHYDNIDSTNQECLRLLAGGQSAPFAVIADRQFMGRGRHGRTWQSDSGNLFYSLAVSVQKPLRECSQLSFIAAVAARDAIMACANAPIAIQFKWPNDLLCHSKKIGGLLIEHAAQNKTQQLLIIGIGINIMLSPIQTAFPASSIYHETGMSMDRGGLAAMLTEKLMAAIDVWQNSGFDGFRADWLASAWHLGEKITISDQKSADGTPLCGIFLDLAADGALLLQTENGETRSVLSGMVA
ncbi:MAG: biotin--[acetyl-CoA-carboxylase] ligase [Alphaproteobacteria bacterium]|nr:biotin--[acetyl-CoA-carboxylase] ligase [Alphaproteobacteria bacterium]